MSYESIKPFAVGQVGRGSRSGSPAGVKDILSHKPDTYSAHYNKDDHAEASQVHYRLAREHQTAKRPQQAKHHDTMATWHRERSV